MKPAITPEPNGGLTHFNADTARDLLKAIASPRNNHIELFQKAVQIGLKDLEDLTKRVAGKLAQLKVDSGCTVMKTLISLDKDRSYQLIGWPQFQRFDWKIPEKTKSITMTWEFMYQRAEGSDPEFHSLSVRITEAPHPMHFLRAALSRDREEVERMEIQMAPVICEVDYMDRLLSLELVQIVSGWHSALRRPAPLTGIGEFIQKNQAKICQVTDLSLEFIMPLAYLSAAYLWMRGKISEPLSTAFVAYSAALIMIFSMVVKIANRLSTIIATAADRNIDRMGRFPIFELTNGDQNNLTIAISKITLSTYKFWGGVLLAFLINVASTVFTFYVLGLK